MEDAKPHTRFILIFSPLTQWYGILLSDLGDYMGTKHKLEKSLVIRKHLEVNTNLLQGRIITMCICI